MARPAKLIGTDARTVTVGKVTATVSKATNNDGIPGFAIARTISGTIDGIKINKTVRSFVPASDAAFVATYLESEA